MWCVDLNKNPNGWIWKHWHVISHNLWICNISKIVERCLVCTLHHSVTVKPQSLAVAVCKHCCNYYPEGDVLLQTCFTPVALDKMWLLWWSWPSPPFRSELERYRKDISSTTLPRSVTSMWTYCLLTKDGSRTSVQTCNNTRLWLRAKKLLKQTRIKSAQLWVWNLCACLQCEAILLPHQGEELMVCLPHSTVLGHSGVECSLVDVGDAHFQFLLVVTSREKSVLIAWYPKAVWAECSASVQRSSLSAFMDIKALFSFHLVLPGLSRSTSERSQMEEISSKANLKNNQFF